jgi:hypothetical protein
MQTTNVLIQSQQVDAKMQKVMENATKDLHRLVAD